VDRFRTVVFPVITGSSGRERIYDGFPDVAVDMISSRTFEVASNCSSTFRQFSLGRRARTRSTSDGHQLAQRPLGRSLRDLVDARIDDDVQIDVPEEARIAFWRRRRRPTMRASCGLGRVDEVPSGHVAGDEQRTLSVSGGPSRRDSPPPGDRTDPGKICVTRETGVGFAQGAAM
jgi:hypothetical protein